MAPLESEAPRPNRGNTPLASELSKQASNTLKIYLGYSISRTPFKGRPVDRRSAQLPAVAARRFRSSHNPRTASLPPRPRPTGGQARAEAASRKVVFRPPRPAGQRQGRRRRPPAPAGRPPRGLGARAPGTLCPRAAPGAAAVDGGRPAAAMAAAAALPPPLAAALGRRHGRGQGPERLGQRGAAPRAPGRLAAGPAARPLGPARLRQPAAAF
jgi:hypothetical protein